jgi:hypothetical protein
VGLAVVGLGGVDVWRSGKRGIPLLSPLDQIDWRGRSVVVLFDSDAAQKPDVVRAQRSLAGALVHLGARARVGALPTAEDGSKQGLDDFVARHLGRGDRADPSKPAEVARRAVEVLLESAPGFPESDALWGMNEELVYVQNPGLVVERDSGRAMDPSKFTAHHYSNRYYMETTTSAKTGVVTKKKPLAPRWLDWEHRFERTGLVYEPGKPRLMDDGSWNTWNGWGCTPKKGDIGPWKRLLDFLFRDAPESRQWFERWCAYPIQHPGTKLYTAAVLWSVRHGMGKGLVEYMLAAIYGKNAIEIDSQMLRGSFNSWAMRKQFVIGNEITAGEARLDKDKLKSMITRREIIINEKYMPEYAIRDCINYLFDGNNPDVLFVEDNDRRYFIHEVIGDPAPPAFYEEMDKFLKGDGPQILFHHLLTLPLGDFKPLAPALCTAAKRAMIQNAKSDVAYWVSMLKDDPVSALKPLGMKAARECDLFTPQQLLRCYDPEGMKRVTPPGMAREVIRSGFRMMNNGTPVWTKNGTQRLYAIRNMTKWMGKFPQDLAAHYERYFGPDTRKF